jgi:hypothetical protein
MITGHADLELTRIKDIIECKVSVDGRADLEEVFGRLLSFGGEPSPKTLDLIGHSSPDSLLQLGDWVLDASSSIVSAFFRELADNDILPRLGIHAVRLLGCSTATTEKSKWTLYSLADILGLEVYGTKNMLFASHYDTKGFRRDREYLLVCSSDLRADRDEGRELPSQVEAFTRALDIDGLPTAPLIKQSAWPHRLATRDDVRALLHLIRRTEGATMPGLLATPQCEIAMPSVRPGEYHRAQLLFDGAFIRVYPDGHDRPGVVYPANDPRALRALVATLQLLN